MTRFLLIGLLLFPVLAAADTIATKDGKTYTCPGDLWTRNTKNDFVCQYTINPDSIIFVKPGTELPPPLPPTEPSDPKPPATDPLIVIPAALGSGSVRNVSVGGWSAAYDAAQPGDVLQLQAGVHGDLTKVQKDMLTIRGNCADPSAVVVDGAAIRATFGTLPESGKAIIVKAHTGTLAVECLTLKNARQHTNSACMRGDRTGLWVVRNVVCQNAGDGVLDTGASWLIENTTFRDVGDPNDSRGTHGMYFTNTLPDPVKIVLRNVRVENVRQNTALQVFGPKVIRIEGGYYEGLNGHTLNFGEGCTSATVNGTIIHRPANADGNKTAIRAECAVSVENSTFTKDASLDHAYLNGTGAGVVKGAVPSWLVLEGGWKLVP